MRERWYSRRKKGRPRDRWMNEVKMDLKRMGVVVGGEVWMIDGEGGLY